MLRSLHACSLAAAHSLAGGSNWISRRYSLARHEAQATVMCSTMISSMRFSRPLPRFPQVASRLTGKLPTHRQAQERAPRGQGAQGIAVLRRVSLPSRRKRRRSSCARLERAGCAPDRRGRRAQRRRPRGHEALPVGCIEEGPVLRPALAE